jgi:hypothetical protein
VLYPKDPKVSVERAGNSLKIIVDYRKWEASFLIVFAIIFIGSGFGIAATPMRYGEPRSEEDIIFLFGMLGFFALFMLIVAIAGLFNKATIWASRDKLICKIRPIGRTISLDVAGAKQFFVGRTLPSGATTASLYLLDRQDHARRILGAFPSPFSSHQICHELCVIS